MPGALWRDPKAACPGEPHDGTDVLGGLGEHDGTRMLVGWAALRIRALPRALGWLGVVTGAAGVATVLPAADVFESIFGLGLLVWFTWAGVVLIRGSSLRSR